MTTVKRSDPWFQKFHQFFIEGVRKHMNRLFRQRAERKREGQIERENG